MSMKKSELKVRVGKAKTETAEAINVILYALTNHGQKKKLLKDKKVIELLEKYGLEIEV